jgi:membrane-associated phospholipid phosphatase
MMTDRRILRQIGPIIAVLMAAASARAAPGVTADPVPLPPKASPARHHLLYHDIVVGVSAALYLSSEVQLKSTFAPVVCRWCEVPSFDRSVRDSLRWSNTDRANTISNYTGLVLPAVVPVGILFFSGWSDGKVADGIDDSLAVAEAAIGTGLITQVIKYSTGRQRPLVHYDGDPLRVTSSDDNVSFISGHTSFAFSIATASGSIASARGYKTAPLIWGIGMSLAATTGYLRIAADKHYLSDVVLGAAVGSAVGLLMPRWLHDHGKIGTQVVPAPGGLAILGTF